MNSTVRTTVLLAMLGVGIILVGYDFIYARPRAKKLYDAIVEYTDDASKKNTPPPADNKPVLYTPTDIHKMLGEKLNGSGEIKPSKVTAVESGYLVETYSVIAGALFKSHDVHVIYTTSSPEAAKEGRVEAKFSTVAQGEFPKGDLLPPTKFADPATAGEAPPAIKPGSVSAPGGNGGEKKEEEAKKEEPKPEAPAGESKVEDKKPEEKKEEPKSEEAPAKPEGDEKPAGDKPAEEKPAEAKPAEEKPAEEKPAEEKKPAESTP